MVSLTDIIVLHLPQCGLEGFKAEVSLTTVVRTKHHSIQSILVVTRTFTATICGQDPIKTGTTAHTLEKHHANTPSSYSNTKAWNNRPPVIASKRCRDLKQNSSATEESGSQKTSPKTAFTLLAVVPDTVTTSSAKPKTRPFSHRHTTPLVAAPPSTDAVTFMIATVVARLHLIDNHHGKIHRIGGTASHS